MNEHHPLQRLILLAIEQQDMARPRSMQREVGPSDLGDPCDHCLAAKLAGWQKRPEVAWLPYIGTAVHAQLAEAFHGEDWASEQHLAIGKVAGTWIKGTADLIHWPTRTVIDFKVVGKTTLDAARRGKVSEQYRNQVHLYGHGFRASHVAIAFLPRNEISLNTMVYWTEPYDATVARSALQRAESLVGVDVTKQERRRGCYEGPRYDDWTTQAVSPGTLESLIGA
jgi:hypothetical protein